MDQYQIGKFIAACRKEKNLTQMQLAEKLGITDRAVSKWENGKALPDSSIMLDLCDLLDITVNDLLSGEKVSSEDYSRSLEEKLLETINAKEKSDKMLMGLQRGLAVISLCIIGTIMVLTWDVYTWWVVPILIFWELATICFAIVASKITRMAGYYKCENCGQAYIPSAKEFRWALGWTSNRMRFKCRYCGQKAHHKKVYRKE